jgi:ectoine hydroxylase-related dioxygenase (phytanoyl-CoA dioxygenase family)
MGRPGADHDLGKKQFVRVFNLHESRPALRPLFYSKRLAKAAHELAGMEGGIRHYQNQAFFKEQEDGATLYHADNLACPLDTRNQYVTAWVPLANVTTEMGLLTFASGSHNDMALNYWNSGQKQLEKSTAGGSFYVYQGQFVEDRYTMANYGAMSPGDVSFHAGWTIHGAAATPAHRHTRVNKTRQVVAYTHTPRADRTTKSFFALRCPARWVAGGMPNVGDSTREAVAVSWVPDQTSMLPAFDVVGKYSSDDKLTMGRLLKLKPGMPVPDEMLPTVWSPAASPAAEEGGGRGTAARKQEL